MERNYKTAGPSEFKTFEHAGWEHAASGYHGAFGALTQQAIPALLDAAGVRAVARVLDVASGPGYAAAAAAGRGARVTGVDFSAEMVAAAKRRAPRVEFREADAENLPFPEAAFDAVVMNFGMLHLAQPERAMGEARRVLSPGGRFAFTVWAEPPETVGFGIVLRAIEAHGNLNVPLPPGPPFFRFANAEESRAALAGAGFAQPQSQKVALTWLLDSPEALFHSFYEPSVRTRALLRAQAPEALAAIRRAITTEAARHVRDGKVILPMPAVLSSATKG